MKDFIGTYIINNLIFWIIFITIIIFIISYHELKINTKVILAKKSLKKLGKNKYIILNDIVINSTRKVHKIDNIIISSYGIFIIKYLDVTGKIYGDDREDKWIELTDKKKIYIDNPVKENHSSIRVLSKLLDLDSSYFIPIICVPSDAIICTETKDKITQVELLDDTIKTYRKEVIKYGLLEIKKKLKNSNLKRESSIFNDREEKDNNTCPKCGSKLVVRKGKYGEFVGCSNYPNCKFTKEI